MKLVVLDVKSYDDQIIENAIDDIFNQLGGIQNIIPQNKKVLLKVNLVRDMAPEKCGTTHPSVVKALAKKLVKECNSTVVVGDSSGGAYTKSFMNTVYRATKMDYACNESGATLNYDFDYSHIAINGKILPSLDIINAFIDADVVINVGKLKSHSYAGFTGCVKNLYGLIPGLVKAEIHSKFPNINEFMEVLVDIEQYAKQKIVLNVLDAVIGMDGEGPTNGSPKFIGKIIASQNPYLVDVAGVTLFDQPTKMPLIRKAIERGVISKDFSETDFDFNVLKNDYISDFNRIDVIPVNFLKMPKWLRKLMKSALCPKVKPIYRKCKGCGKCKEHCPNNAITLVNHKAYVNQNKCIRCYCCQELCPFNAIKLCKPIVYKVVRGFSHTKNKVKK